MPAGKGSHSAAGDERFQDGIPSRRCGGDFIGMREITRCYGLKIKAKYRYTDILTDTIIVAVPK